MDYNYKSSLFHRISEFHYFSELLDNKIDNMIEHPWIELQVLIKEKWLTQKAFASILWKKVSEVNELLKWKRNITIQRDYLLHQTLWTPMKYRILKQVDYDYSLLDIEESNLTTPQSLRDSSPNREQNSDDNFTPLWGGDAEGRGGWLQHPTHHSEQSEESIDVNMPSWTQWKIQENIQQTDSLTNEWTPEWQTKPQETPIKNSKIEDDEDLKNRANIFRSF